MSRSAFARVLLIGAGIVALAPAVWWIVGLIGTWAPAEDADYLVHPLRLPSLVEPALGLLSVFLAGFAARQLHRGVRNGEFRSEWWQVAAALGAITAFGGFAYRIVTEPVIGANIGGVAVILFGLPYSVGMLLWAGIRADQQIFCRVDECRLLHPWRYGAIWAALFSLPGFVIFSPLRGAVELAVIFVFLGLLGSWGPVRRRVKRRIARRYRGNR